MLNISLFFFLLPEGDILSRLFYHFLSRYYTMYGALLSWCSTHLSINSRTPFTTLEFKEISVEIAQYMYQDLSQCVSDLFFI